MWYVKARRAQNTDDYETWEEGGVCTTLNAFDNGTETRATVIVDDMEVRRLTPVECERLQGFPDDWTAGLADSHRYKQMGNAVTVNVANYVGLLIMEAASEHV